MKYIDKFPDMKPIFDERDGIIRTTRNVVCCVCGAPTEFIELNYEDSFCSEECVAEMDRLADEQTKKLWNRCWPGAMDYSGHGQRI